MGSSVWNSHTAAQIGVEMASESCRHFGRERVSWSFPGIYFSIGGKYNSTLLTLVWSSLVANEAPTQEGGHLLSSQ